MIAKIYSAIPDGYDGQIVTVEGSMSRNLPTFNIVGMANKTITESRERVRSAITNSGLTFPARKVTVNLAPAELTKTGSHLDLPIALAVLLLSKHILPQDVEHRLFVGELSLDGLVKPVRGIINTIEAAKSAGFNEIYIPEANLSQTRLFSGIHIIGVSSLGDLILHLRGIKSLVEPPEDSVSPGVVKNTTTDKTYLFGSIQGQELAKRALIIALAGHHNILLSGPPGTGKTMLARVAASLLPTPSSEQKLQITKIHALHSSLDNIITSRPFRSPHHTASLSSIIGGGALATPGEISLAHQGILFLDELPEFPRPVIESLRQPLEDREISISRLNQRTTYPADFTLIATMNPCPCGYYSDPAHTCSCSASQIQKYHERISGPILDRIDLFVSVNRPKNLDLFNNAPSTSGTISDQDIQSLIKSAESIQLRRYQSNTYNSSLSSQDMTKYIHLEQAAHSLLNTAIEKLNLSARSYSRIIKVAQTIADLAKSDIITTKHISEALSFRQQPMNKPF